jgi:hypothetical protein
VLGLLVAMSWVATIIIAGTMEIANRVNALLRWVVTILIAGTKEMQEQVGWKIERDHTERWMKVVCKIEQNNQEQFGCRIERDKTEQGKIMSDDDGVPSSKNMVQTYRNGVVNRVSRFISSQMDDLLSRKYKVMNYVKHAASLRKVLKPNAVWDGVNKSFEMINEDGVVHREEVVIAVPWIS